MITSKVSILIVAVLLAFHVDTSPARTMDPPAHSGNVTAATALSWNKTNHEAPFLPLPNNSHSDLHAQLVYPTGDFAVPLLQSLYHDLTCDCYTLTVSLRASGALQMVNFSRAPQGFYRTGSGPYLELEDFEFLKAITTLNGTRFLFAQVGDGEWRCVSIHDSGGSYLLIDYRADGLIRCLRDSLSRTAIPTYSEGRLISLTQTWANRSGQQMRTTLLQ